MILRPVCRGMAAGVSMLLWLVGAMLVVACGVLCCLHYGRSLQVWLENELLAILRRCMQTAMDETTSKLAWRVATEAVLSGFTAVLAPLVPSQLQPLVPSSLASLSNWAK